MAFAIRILLLVLCVASTKFVHIDEDETMNCKAGTSLINQTYAAVYYADKTEETFRKDCMLRCMTSPSCASSGAGYLMVDWEYMSCQFYRFCVTFYGSDEVIEVEQSEDAEYYTIIANVVKSSELECYSSDDCSIGAYRNCCKADFDVVPVCAWGGSVHCQVGGCTSGEHYCETLNSGTKCIPKWFSCPRKMSIYQPIMIVFGMILVGIISCFYTYFDDVADNPYRQTPYFLSYDRSKFKETGVEFPPNPPKIVFNYDTKHFSVVLTCKKFAQTALSNAIGTSIQLALVTLLICWIRTFVRSNDVEDYEDWLNEGQMMATIDAIAYLVTLIDSSVSFLLIFVLVNQLRWFSSVVHEFYNISNNIISLGLLAFDKCPQEKHFDCYRYLNLAHIFFHRQTTQDILHGFTYKDMIRCGLLEPDEAEEISQTHPEDRVQIIMKWAVHLTLDDGLERSWTSLREKMYKARAIYFESMPFSLVQIMMGLTYFFILLLPCSIYSEMIGEEDANYSNKIPFYPAVATFLVSTFYLGLYHLIVNLDEPTGKDVDDYNPEALLVEADRGLVQYLHTPHQQSRKLIKVTTQKLKKEDLNFEDGEDSADRDTPLV